MQLLRAAGGRLFARAARDCGVEEAAPGLGGDDATRRGRRGRRGASRGEGTAVGKGPASRGEAAVVEEPAVRRAVMGFALVSRRGAHRGHRAPSDMRIFIAANTYVTSAAVSPVPMSLPAPCTQSALTASARARVIVPSGAGTARAGSGTPPRLAGPAAIEETAMASRLLRRHQSTPWRVSV